MEVILVRLFLFHRNPYHLNCLANYGGPVEPAIAVGGFLSTDQSLKHPSYEHATAIILTFLINNHYNKSDLKATLEWEETLV